MDSSNYEPHVWLCGCIDFCACTLPQNLLLYSLMLWTTLNVVPSLKSLLYRCLKNHAIFLNFCVFWTFTVCINYCTVALEFMPFYWYNCLENHSFLSLPISCNLCKSFLSEFFLLSCSSSLQKHSLWNVNNELGLSFPSIFVWVTSISKSMA